VHASSELSFAGKRGNPQYKVNEILNWVARLLDYNVSKL
jgi:hypothetical protein